MMFLFRDLGNQISRGHKAAQSGMLMMGLLSLFFGLAIIAAPELLAYIVAIFFVVTGISILTVWWSLRK